MIKISVLQRSDEEEYTSFLERMQGTLFYHSLKYKVFIERLLDCHAEYLIAKVNNKIVGVLPLMKKSGKFGDVYNSLPYYGSHGGIITENEAVFRALLERYRQIIGQENMASATLIENPFHSMVYDSIEANLYDVRISQVTPLPPTGKDDLFKSFDSSTRRNINKAIASGISIEKDNSQLAFIQEVHFENMKGIGGRAKSPQFFDSIPHIFQSEKDYQIYVARKDGQLIAGLLLFYFKETVEYFTPVVKEEFRTYQPLALIIYQAMQDAINGGYSQWNWGGTWLSQEGVYRFKKKWGSIDREYRYHVTLKNPLIYTSNPQELLEHYPDFFVIPFQSLQTSVL